MDTRGFLAVARRDLDQSRRIAQGRSEHGDPLFDELVEEVRLLRLAIDRIAYVVESGAPAG